MLYVVATPIGNLSDMSPRAVETLKNVSVIAAEDTRVAMKLTAHFGIKTPLTSCHQHNERDKSVRIVERMLTENIDVALITDAGTPAISDPGTWLVRACADAGIPVTAVAGPSAMAAALSVAGFEFSEFTFVGFLPREKGALREKLLDLSARTEVAVLHESPHRVIPLMREICGTLPGALVSVSCDLTKLHELTLRGAAEEVLSLMEANEKAEKGEYCVVLDLRGVHKAPEKAAPAISLEARLFDCFLQGMNMKSAVAALAAEGENKNAAYAASLRVLRILNNPETAGQAAAREESI